MREIRVCCTSELSTGFRLAGLAVDEAANVDEARATVAADPQALWLVQDVLARGMPGTFVVPFPSPEWREAVADEHVLEILRRAIGYRVRLR